MVGGTISLAAALLLVPQDRDHFSRLLAVGALIVLFVFNKIGPHYHWNQLMH